VVFKSVGDSLPGSVATWASVAMLAAALKIIPCISRVPFGALSAGWPSICSVVVGTPSRTVCCGLCAGPTFHSCPSGTGVVQRRGSSIGNSRGGTADQADPADW